MIRAHRGIGGQKTMGFSMSVLIFKKHHNCVFYAKNFLLAKSKSKFSQGKRHIKHI